LPISAKIEAMKLGHLAFILLPAVLALLVLVPSQGNELKERFAAFDANQDGVLAGAELDGSPLLRRLDLDGDGQVTPGEAAKALGAAMKKAKSSTERLDGLKTTVVFDRVDRNGDGWLTPEELPDEAWFSRLDVDKDGRVTREEAVAGIGEVFSSRVPSGPAVATAEVTSLMEGPKVLKGSEVGVGRRVGEATLRDVEGKPLELAQLVGAKGLVLGLFTVDCPISRKLGPELRRLEVDLEEQGFGVVWLNALPKAEAAASHQFASDFGLTAVVCHDPDGVLLTALQATTTTEVFLIDAAQTLVYRGAIHDQYGLGYAKEKASRHYLREAVTAVLGGQQPQVTATTAPGCALDWPTAPSALSAAGTSVTYHRDIARILQTHCVECHRPGGIGPFALDSLDQVLEHAGMIRKQVERGAMPPWFAKPDPAATHALFANDSSLNAADKAALIQWLSSAERPVGDPAQAPLTRRFAESWSIGTPDTVLTLPKPIEVKAEGVMPYQNVVIETDFSEDRWVSAYEIQPSARQVVHHVIVRVHRPGERIRGLGEGDGFWAAYVPGNSYRVLPPGFARLLPAGARLSFQIHYTPVGKAMTDQPRIGLIFAKELPQFEVRVAALAKPRIRIPAGAADHAEVLSRQLPEDFMVTGFMPHLHTRGKAFSYAVRFPDGRQEMLLDVPRYDFNWQLQYTYAQPKHLPAGSTLTLTAVYDNSAGNPANPDPTQEVRWGEQTWDEMMIGYIEHFIPRRVEGVTSSR
jgi:mono/diheme cytochrome c family protein/Ca2+-binding EF-hand superfamily protein